MPNPEDERELPDSHGNPFDSTPEELEEGFSIDQLSEAYAKVLKEQQGGTEEEVEVEVERELELETTSASESEKADQEDILDDAACAISPSSILEAILFVGAPQGTKLTDRKIASLMRDVSPKEVRALVKELNKTYEAENAAYRIAKDKTSFRMELAEHAAPVKEKFYGEIRTARLSQPAVDVLAVVAYHQPVTKERVDKIRMRSSSSLLSQLVRRQLLEIQKTDTKPVKKQYVTTSRFLKLFGLEGLEDLPQTHEVSSLDDLAM